MVLTVGGGPFVPVDEDVPHEEALPDLYGLGIGRGVGMWQAHYETPDGAILLWVDEDECDFHIDAKAGYKASDMRAVLEVARSRGLEPLDEDECEPEILEDGTVRIYLAIAMQPAPAPVADVQEKRRRSAARRSTYAFALAASAAVALLMPSPLHTSYPEAITQVFTDEDEAPVSDTIPTTSNTAPMPSSRGELSGPDSQGHPAGQAPAPQSVRPQGWVGTPPGSSPAGRETQGAHANDDVHRLHRGQEQPDGLGQANGAGGSSPTPGPGGASPTPGPGSEGGQGILGLLVGTVDGLLGRQ